MKLKSDHKALLVSFQSYVGVICLIRTVLLEMSSEISVCWFLKFCSHMRVFAVFQEIIVSQSKSLFDYL